MSSTINEIVKSKSQKIRQKIKEEKGLVVNDLVLDDDYTGVYERCCENILGYRKVPIGISHNPVYINNLCFYIPICTFEGALVASMCRGIKLLNACRIQEGCVREYSRSVGEEGSRSVGEEGSRSVGEEGSRSVGEEGNVTVNTRTDAHQSKNATQPLQQPQETTGLQGFVENLGITRSIALEFTNHQTARSFYFWLKQSCNIQTLKEAGNANSRYCKIRHIESKHLFGSVVYMKVNAYTGDAMGMNMITKACNQISTKIIEIFPNTKLITLSANICTDKKWSIENYVNGRGRKVFLHVKIQERHLQEIMKISINDLLKVYHYKIVLGGSIVLGGFNCQAANYVAATFLAFNQDLGHVLESSNCIIDMQACNGVLEVNLYMPSLIVGTTGGGTHLQPACGLFEQFKNIDCSVFNKHDDDLSTTSNYLALTIAAAVLAGELSAMCALANNTLMDAHLKLNRRK